VNGLLLIDKAQGMTSHDVVARVRRIINMRSIGHAGTLDPFATGLLILCIGHATRLSEYLLGETKTYLGRMKLGERTNTDDVDGEVVAQRPVHIAQADLERVRAQFYGDILQVPPQYSAIQIGGQRAYKMARHGETVDLPARPVHISELTLTWPGEGPFVELRVTCTAGTYIRALARDMGEALGCGAHLTALRRVQSGSFRLDEALTLEQLQTAVRDGDWARCLLPMDRAVEHLPAVHLDHERAARLLLGQNVPAQTDANAPASDLCRVYDETGLFIAIGGYDGATTSVRPLKVFHPRE
jgi:tRNA pseudouridine55 synthase